MMEDLATLSDMWNIERKESIRVSCAWQSAAEEEIGERSSAYARWVKEREGEN